MDAFIRHAEEILETAVEAQASNSPEYLITVSPMGSIRILSETAGWSLPALAADSGALAVYKVARRGNQIRVEGWSLSRTVTVTRDLPKPRPIHPMGFTQMALAPLGWAA